MACVFVRCEGDPEIKHAILAAEIALFLVRVAADTPYDEGALSSSVVLEFQPQVAVRDIIK